MYLACWRHLLTHTQAKRFGWVRQIELFDRYRLLAVDIELFGKHGYKFAFGFTREILLKFCITIMFFESY